MLIYLPTRKNNILDLVFSNSGLIDSIDICDTVISDHWLLTQSSIFEILNFKRCNWLTLQCALRDIDWGA